MDELNILNVLGQNNEAQAALREILSNKYPTLETEFNLSDQIIDKYFDWSFNFEYTADGGGLKRWKTVINSYCGRNPKLNVLQQYFTANDTNATLEEVYSGEDVTDFTDNRESSSETGFNAVGNNSTTTGLSNEVKSKFADGKNTTKNVFKHGQKRTYADGRTWQEILADTETMQAPIYKFINGWANVLVNPCECLNVVECLPTVSATAKAEKGENASVTVKNTGTPYNAKFDFNFVLPKGDKGEQGEQGIQGIQGIQGDNGLEALFYTRHHSNNSLPSYGSSFSLPLMYLNRTPNVGDNCFVLFYGIDDMAGRSWIVTANVQNISTNIVTLTLIDKVETTGKQGEKGEQGIQGPQGPKGDAGINSALLSNEDGDSTENGFTQFAVKGIAQAKNYYNLGAYDTYVSNGDGTGTVARKTKYNDDGTQSLLDAVYQYSETVIENHPLNTLDQNGSQWLREEWEKGINLLNDTSIQGKEFPANTQSYIIPFKITEGTYTSFMSVGDGSITTPLYSLGIYLRDASGQNIRSISDFSNPNSYSTFTLSKEEADRVAEVLIFYNHTAFEGEIFNGAMIVKGSGRYPYTPYSGKIVREKDLSGIQLFPEGVNPAETIGGDWEDLGTVTVGSTTLHVWQKIN